MLWAAPVPLYTRKPSFLAMVIKRNLLLWLLWRTHPISFCHTHQPSQILTLFMSKLKIVDSLRFCKIFSPFPHDNWSILTLLSTAHKSLPMSHIAQFQSPQPYEIIISDQLSFALVGSNYYKAHQRKKIGKLKMSSRTRLIHIYHNMHPTYLRTGPTVWDSQPHQPTGSHIF